MTLSDAAFTWASTALYSAVEDNNDVHLDQLLAYVPQDRLLELGLVHTAAAAGNITTTKILLKAGCNVNEFDSMCRTPLMEFCYQCRQENCFSGPKEDYLKSILKLGAYARYTDFRGNDAIYYLGGHDDNKRLVDILKEACCKH